MKISAVKGFRDVLPEESARWNWIETSARQLFAHYNYSELRFPIAERVALFSRSIGETTDIVEKEMYTFEDRDGTVLALRPEGTASVVRAYVEHSLQVKESVSKLFYAGPMFRRERPQKGRYRQFHQIGCEVLGRDDTAIDAEVIVLTDDLLRRLGVATARFQLNSLGDQACRPRYRAALTAWGRAHFEQLCDNCRRRLEQNPLRLLDCKDERCREVTISAPSMEEYLCAPCREHFDGVRSILEGEGVDFRVDARLVRGLDYYNRTAFEIQAEGLGAQNAVGGGGRYDGLVKAAGGPDVGGVGMALGVERLAMVAGETPAQPAVEIFIAPLGREADPAAARLAHQLRLRGANVEAESGSRSLKSHMRRADKLGVRYVVIVGEQELGRGAASVRDMVAKLDFQCAVPLDARPEDFLTTLRHLAAEPSSQTA
jgi:histidyl-tRNA synthetase